MSNESSMLAALVSISICSTHCSSLQAPSVDRFVSQALKESHLGTSACYRSAYAAIDGTDCDILSETSKRVFALALTECHLEAAQRPGACLGGGTTPVSGDNTLDTSCLASASSEAFSVFTAFTLHIDSLCSFAYARSAERRALELADTLTRTQAAALNTSLSALAHAERLSTKLSRIELATETIELATEARVDGHRRGGSRLLRDLGYAAAATTMMIATSLEVIRRSRFVAAAIIFFSYIIERTIDAHADKHMAGAGDELFLSYLGWFFTMILTAGGGAVLEARTRLRLAAALATLSALIASSLTPLPPLEQLIMSLHSKIDSSLHRQPRRDGVTRDGESSESDDSTFDGESIEDTPSSPGTPDMRESAADFSRCIFARAIESRGRLLALADIDVGDDLALENLHPAIEPEAADGITDFADDWETSEDED